MKKLYLIFSLILGLFVNESIAQLTFDTDPVSITLECNDDDNNTQIEDYLNDLIAMDATCANDPLITWDYSDPGNFEDGDVITIEIIVEDDCASSPDLIVPIDVTIEDTTAPTLDDAAEDLTEACDLPNNATLLMNWVDDHAGATYLDDCSSDAELTWFTNPDPVDINDIALDCGGDITVDFWVEDAAGNSSTPTTATFTLEDTEDPSFNDANGLWDMDFECDGAGNIGDIASHMADIIAGLNISDNCTDVSLLILTDNWDGGGFTTADCSDTEAEIEVEFTLEDDCGNTTVYTATFTLIDTTDPEVTTAATDLVLECDDATNDTDIQNWLDAVGNAVFSDICTDALDLIIDNDYDGSKPDCDGNTELVTFTITDLCGNDIETSANIIIDDTMLPTITGLETSPASIECVNEVITSEGFETLINSIVGAATLEDANDCTDPSDLIIIITPDHTTPPAGADVPDPDCPGGTLTGQYIFDVVIEDECGNQSALETITITVEDTTDPLLPGNLPVDETYDCASDIPTGMDIFTPDECESPAAIFEEVYIIENCDNQVEIERTWIFEDYCGNSIGDYVQTIIVDDQDPPEWIGDEDDYLPGDISLVLANCDAGFSFPNGVYEDEANGDIWPIYPPADGSEFEDLCQPVTFSQIGPPPTEQFDGGETCITFIVSDACGNSITHEFCVDIICSNCEGGGVACEQSCGTVEDGCHTCNIEDLLDGFESCTPNFQGSVLDWPPSLCNGNGVPHNMSWFSFVAGSADLCVTVAPNMCAMGTGAVGLQAGVYDFCEDDDGMCLAGQANCSNGLDEIDFSYSEFVVGNTYYIFVDGCNGAECDYEITVEKGLEFVLDTPEEVVVEASCDQVISFPALQFCPQTELTFNIFHEGDSPSVQGEYDDAGPYNPELSAEFFWTFSPPIPGIGTDGSWETGEDGEDGFPIPPITFPNVMVPTTWTICLTDIEAECSDTECDDCCLDVVIAPLPDEFFGPYEVCVEDLLEINGWDPGIVGEDPNGDGIEWLGPDNIMLEQVEDAIKDDMGIMTFEVFDPECGCMFNQSLQIIPIGNLEPIEVTLYMFDCQFRDEDGDLDTYIWEWPEDTYELNVDMEDFFLNIPEGSEVRDWENSRCDSLLLITVDTAIVEGILTQGPCTPAGTEYCFELLIDLLEDNHDMHPTINPDYFGMKWVDAATGFNAGQGPCFAVTPGTSGSYFVELEYSFIDGAYDASQQVVGECTKIFGPFDLDSGTALPPVVTGENTFCVNDLSGKLFNVTDPIDGYVYSWTFQGGATGSTLNAPANDMADIDFTNYDFGGNLPMLVIADTPCGISEAFEVFVTTIPLPVPDFAVSSPVCVGQLASANFTGDQSQISEYIWSSDNFNSGNQSGPGPVDYSASVEGTYEVSLIIVNNEGCQSLPVTRTFDVIAPLQAPVIDCSETASSVGFSWEAIEGATGYDITVLQHPTDPPGTFIGNSATELSVDFTGLSVNSIVEISVVATGGQPCGNGPAASLECQAQDCPDPDWIFNVWADTSFCVNALIDAYSFDVSGANGTASYESGVPGVVDANGLIDPSAFPVGTTTVTMIYNYQNGDCERSRSINVEVFPQPSADFTASAMEVCLGECITIDDSNVDNVATWDYGVDGSIDANGQVCWTSSGMKTIAVSVTTPDLIGSCANASSIDVMVLDTLIMGEISCINQDLDFVEFDWGDVVGATGYDISYTINDITPPTELNITESTILIDNLMPDDEVIISVTALSPNQCSDVTKTAECVAISCVPLVFNNPVCAEEGIDFVFFEWDAVVGASMYEISINGTVVTTQAELTYLVDGLDAGDIVTITVTALNDLTNCPDVTRTKDCTAGECPEGTFTFTPVDEPCYNAALGGIQLTDPTIAGVLGTGTGSWNSSFVDANGLFTPDAETDMIYMLEYEYVEGTCTYDAELEVEIIIIPIGDIDVSDDDICVTESTTVEGSSEFGNNETAIWDFGNGVNAVGTGFGPYELTFDAPGTYEITLTLDNEGCLSDPVVTSIEVDAELITPEINCLASNSSVEWNWDDVVGVNQYSISIDNVFQTTQTESSFRVDGLSEGENIEITISFISDSSCPIEDLVDVCTTNACPNSTFDIGAFDNEICLDGSESNIQLEIDVINAPPGETGMGSWSGPGVSASGLFNPTGLVGVQELTYSIEYSVCQYQTSINITVFDAPQVTAINPINPDCYLTQIGGIMPEVSGGTEPYMYTVDNLPSQDFPAFIDVLTPGLHDLMVTDANGCTTEQTIEIFAAVEPTLGINGPLSVLVGETGEYTLDTNAENIGDVIWLANGIVICQGTDCEPVSLISTLFPDTDNVELVVQVFFNEDCFVETSIRVDFFEIQKYYIPNVISEFAEDPNNQVWSMYTKGGAILVKTVKIYDRWGELVHDQVINEQAEGRIDLLWDGRWTEDGGPEVIPGVYVYMIEMEVDGRDVVESGDITVIR